MTGEADRIEKEQSKTSWNKAVTVNNGISGSIVSKQSINVAIMMVNATRTKWVETMQWLNKTREKQWSLDSKAHKLLGKVIPMKQTAVKN